MTTDAPPVIWEPTPERVERAAITGFATALSARTGRQFPDYAALWTYSTQDLSGFWFAVADLFEIALARAAHRGR